MATGWTWEYIDEYVTLPRLREMSHYWSQFPPLHVLMAALVRPTRGGASSGAAAAMGERDADGMFNNTGGDLYGDVAAIQAAARGR